MAIPETAFEYGKNSVGGRSPPYTGDTGEADLEAALAWPAGVLLFAGMTGVGGTKHSVIPAQAGIQRYALSTRFAFDVTR